MNALEVIERALTKSIKGTDQRVVAADDVVEALRSAGHLWEDGWVETVEVHHSHVVTERVETYGLVIELDALGNAVTVNSPHGFMVIE